MRLPPIGCRSVGAAADWLALRGAFTLGSCVSLFLDGSLQIIPNEQSASGQKLHFSWKKESFLVVFTNFVVCLFRLLN